MKKLQKFILNRDMFGHDISLNFNRNGKQHRTLITGLFSLFLKICITAYFIQRFYMLIFHEKDDNFTEFGTIDLYNDEEMIDLRYD